MSISDACDKPIAKELNPKISKPIKKIHFLPNKSERRPLNSKNPPKASVYALDTHESAALDNPKLSPICTELVKMIELSINIKKIS